MDPTQISAQFAAFVWFSHGKPDSAETRMQAQNYAKANWTTFLPLAHPGLGRLLLRIGTPRAESGLSARIEMTRELALVG